MGKFVISKRSNNEYQFVLKADNGQTILTSEGYKIKGSCIEGIASVRKNAPTNERYTNNRSSNQKYFFNLKAGNGEVIGTSEMYESSSGRDIGIEAVKKNGPLAGIEDLSGI